MSLSAVQLFEYPGLKLTLALTKPPTVSSHMTGESTYRTQTTGTGADSWQQLSSHV